MADLRIVIVEPNKPPREKAPTITSATWGNYKQVGTRLYECGLTQAKILTYLVDKLEFQPTARQLWAQMTDWGLRRQKNAGTHRNFNRGLLRRGGFIPIGPGVSYKHSCGLLTAKPSYLRNMTSRRMVLTYNGSTITTSFPCSDSDSSYSDWCRVHPNVQHYQSWGHQYFWLVLACDHPPNWDGYDAPRHPTLYKVPMPAWTRLNTYEVDTDETGSPTYHKTHWSKRPGLVSDRVFCKSCYAGVVRLVREWIVHSETIDGRYLIWLYQIVLELARSSWWLSLENASSADYQGTEPDIHLNAADALLSKMWASINQESLLQWLTTVHKCVKREFTDWKVNEFGSELPGMPVSRVSNYEA